MSREVELVHKIKCDLGEGPVWQEETQCLYWVDILNFKLYRLATATSNLVEYPMPSEISCFAFGDDGLIYVALSDGLYSFDETSQQLSFVGRPDDLEDSHRFNDGKCDSSGRFYMGTMDKVYGKATGSLYSVDKTMFFTKHVDKKFVVPNGLSWNDALKKFYHVDTTKGNINAYVYDKQTGAISAPKTIIHVDASQGSPDGMTIDDEGMLWVCHWGGYKICRYNPATGQKIEEIKMPCDKPTSCCFGGADMKDLYITTASIDDAKGELAGSVFKVKVDVGGQSLYKLATK